MDTAKIVQFVLSGLLTLITILLGYLLKGVREDIRHNKVDIMTEIKRVDRKAEQLEEENKSIKGNYLDRFAVVNQSIHQLRIDTLTEIGTLNKMMSELNVSVREHITYCRAVSGGSHDNSSRG